MKRAADVLVVGGGPAGLAAAIALRQRGAEVTVADALRPPIDKACGEGLMPDSRRELALLGVELTTEDGGEFRGIRFANHAAGGVCGLGDVATAEFPAGIGLGLRRQALHARLVERAVAAGVQLRWGCPVQLPGSRSRDGRVMVAGESVAYGWLVGADGQSSRVRSWAGLERGAMMSRRFGFRRHFAVAPWSPYVEVHWARNGQAYVTPVGSDAVCVAVMSRDPQVRLEQVLEELPWLRAKLRAKLGARLRCAGTGAEPLDAERGAVTATRRLRCVARGRVALIGDASGSADAITGEGMAMAFRQSLLLAECLEDGDLVRYDRGHPGILHLPQTMARVMLWMDRFPLFRDRALRMLATEPRLFARMLGVHVGAESLGRFVAAKGLELAWRLAVPARSGMEGTGTTDEDFA